MRRAAKKDGPVPSCGACGSPCPPDAKGRTRMYCSRACVGLVVGRAGQARIRNPPAVKSCQTCGVEFSTFHRQKLFCNRECFWVYRKKNPPACGGGVDKNQPEIISALRKVGAAVARLDALGGGVPDLLVGYRGKIVLMEVKNPETQYGRSGLNKNQKKFADEWKEVVVVVTSVDEALAAMGVACTSTA